MSPLGTDKVLLVMSPRKGSLPCSQVNSLAFVIIAVYPAKNRTANKMVQVSSHQQVDLAAVVSLAVCRIGCLVGCLTSQQQASVSQGRICSDNFTSCRTEIEVADQTFKRSNLTQSQYTDTGPTSAIADPITPGAWQGSHWSANIEITGMTRPRKNPGASGIRTRDLPLSRRTPYH